MKISSTRSAKKNSVRIPAHVPIAERRRFAHAYRVVTRGTDRIMLMAGDQKIEHLNDDFYGQNIHRDDADPEHLFRIASRGDVGCFAAHHGLIAAYGMDYPKIPYVVKMNAKTHLVSTQIDDPRSSAVVSMDDVLHLRQYGKLDVVGIGYTIYFGSRYESDMISEAGKLIAQAHAHGLIAVIWAYPRGQAVSNEKNAHLIAGAAGAASCLGADFVKVNTPEGEPSALNEASLAAGRTGVIVSGGSSQGVKAFLQHTHDTIHLGGCRGAATGRNVHQKSLHEGIAMTRALSALIYRNATVDAAYAVYTSSL